MLERGTDAVAAMLGVLKCGAAVCNISADYPRERVDFICRDINAKFMVDKNFMEQIDSLPQSECTAGTDPSALAVVVYTLGSSGNPKGVLYSDGYKDVQRGRKSSS